MAPSLYVLGIKKPAIKRAKTTAPREAVRVRCAFLLGQIRACTVQTFPSCAAR